MRYAPELCVAASVISAICGVDGWWLFLIAAIYLD